MKNIAIDHRIIEYLKLERTNKDHEIKKRNMTPDFFAARMEVR